MLEGSSFEERRDEWEEKELLHPTSQPQSHPTVQATVTQSCYLNRWKTILFLRRNSWT